MLKKVNGKVVDIKNIELFEKAAEGMALGKLASSMISDKITVESDVINSCINRYEAFYRAMPFPLYALETNVKYAALGEFIRDSLDTPLEMWVDAALFICIDKENSMALKIIANSWGVVKTPFSDINNAYIDEFKSDIGYSEYTWLLNHITNNESTSNFYSEFMPDFLAACNNQPMILKWELSNILTFGGIPEKMELKDNKILNIETQSEYTLDIFTTGYKKTGENEYFMSLVEEKGDVELRPKSVKVYGFDAYEKPKSSTDSSGKTSDDKLQKVGIKGLYNVFETLVAIRMSQERSAFETFTGLLNDGNIVYSVNKRVFVCKAYKQSEIKEIARNMDIYGYDRGYVYIARSLQLTQSIKKEMIYSYSITDGATRLCKIQFVLGA